MATITKQTITRPFNGQRKPDKVQTDSMLSRITPVEELQDDFVRMCLYGANRTGKTTVACMFPKPLLLIAAEPNKTGGATSVKKIPGVHYIKLVSTHQSFQLAKELRNSGNNGGFKSIVYDSATSLQDIILKEILGMEAVPEQLNWGTVSRDQYRERSEKCREALRPYMELDCHFVVTAKEKDHNPPKDEKPEITRGFQLESFIAADLGGATVGWLNDCCDFICQLYVVKQTRKVVDKNKITGKDYTKEVETGKIVRRLRTTLTPNHAAGVRSYNPACVPAYVEGESPQELYEKLMAVRDGTYEPEKE